MTNSTKGAPLLRFEEVVYQYARTPGEEDLQENERAAVDGVSLTIEEGSFVAIIGHNGSGKSTLAKLTNAMLLPQSGTVWVDGMSTADPQHLWDIRQRAGMVFQNPDNQMVATIVEEDVAFGPENLGVPREQIRQRVDEALAMVGMSEFATHSPHMLSGGQKQRIAIAGIIAMRPKIIVMDEPTAMLDPSGRAEVVATAHRLNREEGMTVLLITHYMDEAVGADRVIVMDKGRVVMDGTPRETFLQVEKLHGLGLEVPPMVELAFQLRGEGWPIPADVMDTEGMVEALWPLLSKN